MGKKTKGKEKQVEEKKTVETTKGDSKNASAPIPVPQVQVQRQIDVVIEEPEEDNDITAMEILKDTPDQNGGWGESNAGDDGWGEDVGGGGEERDAYSEHNSLAPSQVSAMPMPQPAVQDWGPLGQAGPPRAPAPPPSPPVPDAPKAVGDAKPGGSKPSGNIGIDSRGRHDQSAGQSWALPNPSLQPSAGVHVPTISASAMARGVKSVVTSASGSKSTPANHSGRNLGEQYWGVPQHIIDASVKTTRNTSASVAPTASGGGSSRQSFSAWGQPKSVDPWGESTVAGVKRGQTWDHYSDDAGRASQHGVQQGRERPITQAWEKWGKPHGWTKPDPGWGDVYDDDEDEESSDPEEWENIPEGWGHPHAQEWTKWGQEAKKVTFAPLGSEGTKSAVSPQQRSEILNSLLNLPSQNQNVNSGHHGHQAGGLRHTQQKNQPKQPSKQQQKLQKQPHHHQHQQQQQQQQQPQHQHQHQQPQHQHQHQHQQKQQYQDHTGKKTKKQKGKQKETPKQSDSWGATGGDGWGADGDGWGASNDGWGNSADDGGDNHDAGNDEWGVGNDSWGTDGWRDGNDGGGHDKGWGGSKDKRGRGKDKGWEGGDDNGWGQDQGWANDSGWGAIPEEDEDEVVASGRVQISSSKNQAQSPLWGRQQTDTSYTMPSKTLAHAYKGTTTMLTNGVSPNKLNEYTNIRFLESRGEALVPVRNALFGKARMAKDRIHWMFSPDKDERVSSMLSWIEKVDYSLGTYGLHRFLQGRERGALLLNAAFRLEKHPNQPAFDWLTFDELQPSMDRTLQESVAFYDPSMQVIVFVFLPSKSGNSVAMWRRKVNVPNNSRLMLQHQINLAMAGLRKQTDYVVHVNELPTEKGTTRRQRRQSLPADGPIATKKRKWWQIFRFEI